MAARAVEFGVRTISSGSVTIEAYPSLTEAARAWRIGRIEGVVLKDIVKREVGPWAKHQ